MPGLVERCGVVKMIRICVPSVFAGGRGAFRYCSLDVYTGESGVALHTHRPGSDSTRRHQFIKDSPATSQPAASFGSAEPFGLAFGRGGHWQVLGAILVLTFVLYVSFPNYGKRNFVKVSLLQ
jgi:hypothetical protein